MENPVGSGYTLASDKSYLRVLGIVSLGLVVLLYPREQPKPNSIEDEHKRAIHELDSTYNERYQSLVNWYTSTKDSLNRDFKKRNLDSLAK